MHGLPYNSQGQAIVERAHRTLKTKLQQLGEGEGHAGTIPVDRQQALLSRALYTLNHFVRGEESTPPLWKHFVPTQETKNYPLVQIREPGSITWETGWSLRVLGRGYAAVEKDGIIKWVPARCVKPDLT